MVPPTSRPMQHIDRKDLYTNLETRVQYLHSFLDFSSSTWFFSSNRVQKPKQQWKITQSQQTKNIIYSVNLTFKHRNLDIRLQIYQSAYSCYREHCIQKTSSVYDITARAFQTRSTSCEGPVEQNLDEDSPQILHRKLFLRGYLNKLCSDPSKMEFWEYLDKVG